jgi:sulfatase modifying factor 1
LLLLVSGGCVGYSSHVKVEPITRAHFEGVEEMPGATPAEPVAPMGEPFTDALPGGEASWDMVPVPAGRVTIVGDDGAEQTVEVGPFWVSTTEVTWDLFDLWVYAFDDLEVTDDVDAITGPSKPYLPPDRGFGYNDYAAISMTHHASAEFCRWLSERTGRVYRLPTEAEWVHAAAAGSRGAYSFGDDASKLGEHAWYKENAGPTTQSVAQKLPNAWGLYDVHGNVAEWAYMMDGREVAMGGSYREPAEELTLSSRLFQDETWNETDPQIPKSIWWLADCSWAGIRLVCEGPAPEAQAN